MRQSRLGKPPPGAQVDWEHPLSRGLVAWWIMNEGWGQRVGDITLGGVAGTLNGNASFAGGRFGVAVSLDGINGYIDLTGVAVSFPHSIAFWANFAVNGLNSYLMDSESGRIIIGINASGNVLGFHDGVSWNNTTKVIADSQWHQVVAVTEQTTGGLTLYVDGLAVAAPTITQRNIGGTTILGARFSKDQDFLKGRMDSVRIYGRPLEAVEVAQLYATPYANLLAPRRLVPVAPPPAPTPSLGHRRALLGVGR